METFVFDPLESFANIPEIVDLIFQHFDFQDLMNVSTVNNFYHDFIFSSPKCIKKVKLLVLSDVEMLQSTRYYQNVKFSRKLENQKVISFLLKSKSWESIDLKGITSLKFLEEFESLEELILREPSSIKEEFKLAHLKKLEIDDCHQDLVLAIVKDSKKLVKLSITNVKPMEKLLQNLADLDHLQLEEFSLSEYSTYNFDQNKSELLDFLKSQTKSLKKLVMDIWVGLPVLKFILCMPKLKHLELFELSKSSYVKWDGLDFPSSKSITYLNLENMSGDKHLLKFFLKACPNVERLSLFELNLNLMEVISTDGKNLKSLKTCMIEKGIVKDRLDEDCREPRPADQEFLIFKLWTNFLTFPEEGKRTWIENILITGAKDAGLCIKTL